MRGVDGSDQYTYVLVTAHHKRDWSLDVEAPEEVEWLSPHSSPLVPDGRDKRLTE